jgi:heat shock protein HtpX
VSEIREAGGSAVANHDSVADTGGANLCGDPMHLARALEKIHAYAKRIPLEVNPAFNSMFIAEPLSAMDSIAGLFSTHPPLEKRLINLIGREATGYYRIAQ